MRTIIIAAALLASATQLWAGGPDNWQMGFSEPASETEARIIALHDHLMLIGMGIVLLVVALLAVAIFRFRASRHPVPSTLTRLPWLEFGWTVAPVAVLGAIAVPSMQLLAYESRIPEADITVKVSADQWFWRYSYPDNGGFTVDSTMTPPSQVAAG